MSENTIAQELKEAISNVMKKHDLVICTEATHDYVYFHFMKQGISFNQLFIPFNSIAISLKPDHGNLDVEWYDVPTDKHIDGLSI